jgi:hypothetical protein
MPKRSRSQRAIDPIVRSRMEAEAVIVRDGAAVAWKQNCQKSEALATASFPVFDGEC